MAIRSTVGLRKAIIARVAAAWLVGTVLTGCMNQGVPETRATATSTPRLVVPEPLPSPAASPQDTSPSSPTIGTVVWAVSVDPVTAEPGLAVSVYTPDATGIYAVLPVAHLRPGDMVRAEWTYNDTPLEALTRTFIVQEAYTEGWIAFSVVRGKDTPWPAGTYAITISINGEVAQSATVEVSASRS